MKTVELSKTRMEDCLIAEYVEGYRKVLGPSTDYDGPCEQYEVLLPPYLMEDDAYRYYPPRGAIAPYFWVSKYSKDSVACEGLLRKFSSRYGEEVSVKIEVSKNCFICRIIKDGEFFAFGNSLNEAIRGAMLMYSKSKKETKG